LIALLNNGSDGDDVATQPEVDEPPAIVAEALATAEEYYAAFNAGDLAGMRALFAPGIEMQQGPGALSLDTWEKQTTFFIAEDGTVEVAECTAVETVPGVAEVTCPFGDRSSVIDAVDATPVPVVATLRIDDSGITRIVESADIADYAVVADPFEAWVAEFHPDDTQAVSCCAFFSVEEAPERGELRRQYAEEWAAWLEENGCVWNEPCEP
jgi:ketosteroid isomerase-like protein